MKKNTKIINKSIKISIKNTIKNNKNTSIKNTIKNTIKNNKNTSKFKYMKLKKNKILHGGFVNKLVLEAAQENKKNNNNNWTFIKAYYQKKETLQHLCNIVFIFVGDEYNIHATAIFKGANPDAIPLIHITLEEYDNDITLEDFNDKDEDYEIKPHTSHHFGYTVSKKYLKNSNIKIREYKYWTTFHNKDKDLNTNRKDNIESFLEYIFYRFMDFLSKANCYTLEDFDTYLPSRNQQKNECTYNSKPNPKKVKLSSESN
jgi:hypothetical protein